MIYIGEQSSRLVKERLNVYIIPILSEIDTMLKNDTSSSQARPELSRFF